MKRIIYILSALTIMSCSGNNEGPAVPGEYTAPFTLSSDVDEVEADGISKVTFSLKDRYDREMLEDRNAMTGITIFSSEGVTVPRLSREVTFMDNGEHVFKARYNGKFSNELTVTAVNRGAYEVYYKKIGVFKATSVDCSACPGFVQAYEEELAEACRKHTVLLAFHGNFQGPDPLAVNTQAGPLGNYLLNSFSLSSWPGSVYDLNRTMIASSPTKMEENINVLRVTNPATCGVKVNSITCEGKSIKVAVSLKSSIGGEYDLACALVEDGVRYEGGYSYNEQGIYNEVVRGVSDGLFRYDPETLMTVGKDEEVTRTLTMNFSTDVPQSSLEGKYVAVWAHRKLADGGSIMDNIVTCDCGSTSEYLLND